MVGKIKVTVKGLKEVQEKFTAFANSGNVYTNTYLDLISESAIQLLRNNTPVDTGELRDSWQEVNRAQNFVEVGVSDDQEDKLQFVLFGTKYTKPNNFIFAIENAINNEMQKFMSGSLRKSHKFWTAIPDVYGTGNITATVGLTGTKYSKKRAFGRATLVRPRTGMKRLRRRIGRRRRVGTSVIKTIKFD